MGFHDSGTPWISLRRGRFLSRYSLLTRIPFQATKGDFPNTHLPLQHQQPGNHLFGHPKRQLEPCIDRLKSSALSLLPSNRLQPSGSFGGQHCISIHSESRRTRQNSQIVDETLCHVNRQNALIEEKRKSKKEKRNGRWYRCIAQCRHSLEGAWLNPEAHSAHWVNPEAIATPIILLKKEQICIDFPCQCWRTTFALARIDGLTPTPTCCPRVYPPAPLPSRLPGQNPLLTTITSCK